MRYRIERVQQIIKPATTKKIKRTKKVIEESLAKAPEIQDKDGNLIELDPGKKYKEIENIETEEVITENMQPQVAELYNLLEIATGKIVFSSARRMDVVNKKNKLEGWAAAKHKQKWN